MLPSTRTNQNLLSKTNVKLEFDTENRVLLLLLLLTLLFWFLFLLMLLFWSCLLLLITLYLLVVNKCSAKAPESYHLVCVDVVAVVCVCVVVKLQS